MNRQKKTCTLHNQAFEYFCEMCYQPVCKQCTLYGPHNTSVHSITSLSIAYERRVHQIKERISSFLTNKEPILSQISSLNNEIETLKKLRDQSLLENEIYKVKMLKELQNKFQIIHNEISLIKQGFQIKMNEINDIGHCIQNITDHIEVIASNSNILHHLKECIDRINLLFQQQHSFQSLPKQLSDLRLDLKQIILFEETYNQKIKILKQILVKLDKEKEDIQQPIIDYQQLLKILSENIDQYITHNVCHYCGIAFSFPNVNSKCPKNNSALDIIQFKGFCLFKPDSTKWATQRHYFAQPAQKQTYFNNPQYSTFSINLSALLLKLKTKCLIKSIKLDRIFQSVDKASKGVCNLIEMRYILMQICGMTQKECKILLFICQKPSNEVYRYQSLLKRLQTVEIGNNYKPFVNNEKPKQEQSIISNSMAFDL